MKMFNPSHTTIRILERIALTAGLFAFVLCILIMVNYYQLRRSDPLNTPGIKILVERLNSNPEDEQLKQQIRELDLLARKAFFTNRWQIKTGGYLLIFTIFVLVSSLKTIELIKPRLPVLPSDQKETFWNDRLLNRKWLSYSGIGLLVFALVFAFLSYRQLGKTLELSATNPAAAKGENTESVSPTANQTGAVSDSSSVSDTASATATAAWASWDELKQNFPGFRGPGGNGIAFQKNIPVQWDGKSGKNIKWKTAVPLTGYNSPVVWREKVFLSGANNSKREVYCYNALDGKLLWTTAIEKIPGSPAASPKVNSETGQAAPTVATNGNLVFAIFANGDIAALSMDGKISWSKNLGLPKNHYGHSSSLLVYQDLVIVQFDQSGNAAVLGLNSTNGEIAWKTSRDVKVSWSSPILVNTGSRFELILVAEPYMISYNPKTGKELWRIESISGEVGPSVAYADGIAYSVNDYSKLAAIKVGSNPTQLWESDEYLSDIPSPLATSSYLFLPTSYGTFVCYDAKDGTKYWEKELGSPTYASPVLVDGKVYQLDKKGVMHIIRPDKVFASIGKPQLGEGSVCTPAFSDGHIFIRGDRNLYCIGK